MSYEKQTWEDGQTITAAKLNHMENGINAANDNATEAQPLIVHGTIDIQTGTAAITDDINVSDIVTAFEWGRVVKFQGALGQEYTVRLEMFQAIGTEITFTACDISSGGIDVYVVEFDNSKNGTFEAMHATAQAEV